MGLLGLGDDLAEIIALLLRGVHLAMTARVYIGQALDAELPQHGDRRLVVVQGDEDHARLLGILDCSLNTVKLRRPPLLLDDR